MCGDSECDGACGCAGSGEPEAMGRMARVLGVDRLLAGTERAEAAERCADCRDKDVCADWLAGAHLRGADHAPRFCLNADRFDALASEAPSTV
jgi:hypothetical protein